MMKSKYVSPWKNSENSKLFTAVILALLLCLAQALWPDECKARIFIDINAPEIERLRIAIPEFQNRSPDGAHLELAPALAEVAAGDLELSGYFLPIEKEAFLEEAVEALDRGTVRFRDWSVIGAELLLEGKYTATGNSLELEVRLHDVFQGRRVFSKRLLGRVDEHRRLVHRLSNELLNLLTGQEGMYLSRIAYVNKHDKHKEIFTCDVDGHNRRQITFDDSIALLPRWSPGGEKIVYNSYKEGGLMLYIRDLSTGQDRRISSREGLNTGACWAPDKESLALTLSRGDNPDIYLIDLKGSILKRLTDHWGIDVSPSFSPDGLKLAFVSNRSGSPQIYVYDLKTGEERRITYEGNYNTSPSWSSRNRIAYAGMNNGRFDIFTINPDGSDLQNLTKGRGNNEDPCWSQDGRYIVFSSNREGRYHLHLMTAGGRLQKRITFQDGEQTSPSWSPY